MNARMDSGIDVSPTVSTAMAGAQAGSCRLLPVVPRCSSSKVRCTSGVVRSPVQHKENE